MRSRRSRSRVLGERSTVALAVVALGTTAGVLGGELLKVWRKGSAPLPSETTDVVSAAGEAARQTVEVAREAYRAAPAGETIALNMIGAGAVAFGTARLSTWLIRHHPRWWPADNVVVGGTHVHHFVPGILLAFASGGAGVFARDPRIDRWLAIPFGVGVAWTLDESALLLRLEDVYWTEEGIVSVQLTLGALLVGSGAVLARRVLRRGEAEVLKSDAA